MKSDKQHMPSQYRTAAEVISLIGDKWTVLVVARLAQGSIRFSQLQREIGGISQKMLAVTLKTLERDGFVIRTVYPVIPPRVEYELTEMGERLLKPLHALGEFIVSHSGEIEAARRRYDDETETLPPQRYVSDS